MLDVCANILERCGLYQFPRSRPNGCGAAVDSQPDDNLEFLHFYRFTSQRLRDLVLLLDPGPLRPVLEREVTPLGALTPSAHAKLGSLGVADWCQGAAPEPVEEALIRTEGIPEARIALDLCILFGAPLPHHQSVFMTESAGSKRLMPIGVWSCACLGRLCARG